MPHQQAGTPFEALMMPLLHLTYTSWLPMPLVHWTHDERFLAANGQVVWLERAALDDIGGFAAVRAEIVDDMALMRRFKRHRHRVVFADGHHVATTRMYEGARELWQGFSKNAFEGIGGRIPAMLAVQALYLACFVLPYVVLGGGLLGVDGWVVPGAVGVAANVPDAWGARPALRSSGVECGAPSCRGGVVRRAARQLVALVPVGSCAMARSGVRGPGPACRLMIRKWPAFARLFRWAVAGHLRTGLDGVYVRGWREARDAVAAGPVLLAPTHVSSWDTLLLLTIEDLLESDAYALMDRDNYDRLPFFGWIGAIPVDRASARPALRAAVELLDRPGRLVIVFPQGRQRPSHLRPLDLQGGIATLARMSGATVQPLALTYAFHESPRPTVYLDFPPALPASVDARELLERLEASLVEGLDRIDEGVEGTLVYEPLVARSSSLRPGLGMRMLGWAARRGGRAG